MSILATWAWRSRDVRASQVKPDPCVDYLLDDLTPYELEHFLLRLSDGVREGPSESWVAYLRISRTSAAQGPFGSTPSLALKALPATLLG